jgi:hypothetical protein
VSGARTIELPRWPLASLASAARRWLSGGYSMMRNTVPFFGGAKRKA